MTLVRAQASLLLQWLLWLSALLALHQELVSFIDSVCEILSIRKKLLEVNDVLIQKSTSNDWGKLFAEPLLNLGIDVVTNKRSSILTYKLLEFRNIRTRELHLWVLRLLKLLLWLLWLLWLLRLHLLSLLIRRSLIVHLLVGKCSWLLSLSHVLLVDWLFVIAILLGSTTLLLLAGVILTLLVLVLVVTTSRPTSSALSITSSTSIWIVSISFVTFSLHLSWISSRPLPLHPWKLIVHFALTHH